VPLSFQLNLIIKRSIFFICSEKISIIILKYLLALLRGKGQVTIFIVLLSVLLFFSLIPAIVIILQSINTLNYTKQISQSALDDTFREQAVKIYISNAENLSKRISDFLYSRVEDLEDLSLVPENKKSFLNFSKNHERYNSSLSKVIPLYKQVALIDIHGQEVIKIVNGSALDKRLLKNVSDPENTTYLTEDYFIATKNSFEEIFIGHLKSWYISRNEQLNFNKTLDGIIRFCLKRKNNAGEFNGIYMIALDINHILDFVNYMNIPKDSLVNKYKKGSYTYIIDDEGWIIAHQKLWDIRGLFKDGNEVPSLDENIPNWKYDSGIIPINLFKMDWRLKDSKTGVPMSELMERVRRGETVFTTMKSMGIHGHTPGIVRSRIYAPIFFNVDGYKKHSIFGAVSVGTSEKEFFMIVNNLTSELEEINATSKNQMLVVTLILSFGAIFFSFIIAKYLSKSLQKINLSLSDIGKGQFEIQGATSSIKEIKELSDMVVKLSKKLRTKETEINQNLKNLESLNTKLVNAERELAEYWKYEYTYEPEHILENRLKGFENNFPKLKEIRESICIGNHPDFLRVLRQTLAQSQMTLPTWLSGETGVGKTALARVIHLLSPRKNGPYSVFAASEFSAADPIIVQGKLFGYGEGHGITGIDKKGRKGIIEECNGGTLFIDDIDSLPLETQAQLLRVIDGMDFHPAVGKSKSIYTDVRFLFASHSNLEELVKKGLFRKDLFRRIGGNFNKIEIPPLRERRSDILAITKNFVKRYNEKFGSNFSISQPALKILMNHDYREGNIGELKVLVQFAYENARIEGTELITPRHLSIKNKLEYKPTVTKEFQNEDELLTSREVKELEILRENNFQMSRSEKELGFKNGSKTLSHHFRGICLKLYVLNNYDIDSTIREITQLNNSETNKKMKSKIEGYINNVNTKIKDKQTTSLFKNLPKEYHQYLSKLLSKFE